MRRRDLFLALSLAALAASGVRADTKAAGQYVDLAPVALPIVVNNRLVNYVFVSVRVHLTSGADAPKLSEHEPYFRDALVRLGHRTPFTNPSDYTVIDVARMKAAMFTASQAIAGAGNVASIELVSQTPKLRLPPPKPAAPR